MEDVPSAGECLEPPGLVQTIKLRRSLFRWQGGLYEGEEVRLFMLIIQIVEDLQRGRRVRTKVHADVLPGFHEQVHEEVVPLEEAGYCFLVIEAVEVGQRRDALVESGIAPVG